MMSFKAAVAVLSLTAGLAAATPANAAECQLRNLTFVSTLSDGRLVINSDMWAVVNGAWVYQGQLGNSTYCKMDGSWNGISAQVCKNWFQTALTAMVTNKKVYLNPSTCSVGNGVNLSGIGVIGLNP